MSQNEVWNEKKYEKNHENVKKYEKFYRSLDKKKHPFLIVKKMKTFFFCQSKNALGFFSFFSLKSVNFIQQRVL